MRPLRSSLRALSAGLLCLASACHADEAEAPAAPAELPELGLMGTIPIYWGESGGFGEVLAGGEVGHWARTRLERDYRLRPLDALGEEDLGGLSFLLLAQPRALTPAENVALDAWVREGGHLLLFADPLMTGESRFAIGDRRRPQDVVLISPILTHWGMALQFDEEQPAGPALVTAEGATIPVNLPGALAVKEGDSQCAVQAAGVLAECVIGEGSVVALADAALLDLHEPHPGAAAALDWLVDEAFATARENVGSDSRDANESE